MDNRFQGSTAVVEASREPYVSRQVGQLSNRIDRIGELVAALEGRLGSVLAPVPPSPKDSGQPMSPPMVPLADTLSDMVVRLTVIADRAESVLARIEL
jgi:hypothetical protein